MSRATKIILTIALAFGACAPGLAQAMATVQGPPGNSVVARKDRVAHVSLANAERQSTVSQEAGGNTAVQPDAQNSAPAGSENQNATSQSDNNLPSSSSALPLLSVIGFGVLVGGIASALKTR
jgi:hypothetical protein